MLKSTFSEFQRCRWQYESIFIRLAVVAFEICESPRNSPKIRTYNSSRSSEVVDLGVNRKLICNFLLVINSNYGRISYRFRDIDAFSSKIACFPHHTLVWRPPGGGAPCDNNVIYMPLKWATIPSLSTLTLWVYLHSCSRCCLPNREITRNFDKIWPYGSLRSSKVIDRGVNRMLTCDFLLVINSNFGRIY